ncbi:beta-N-acetylhexosaminidase [Frigoribacterium sp. 2-23]|uniref:beta-N-acetylhexosaminidase n=1 Tax=Frigoribacterium sp. 2-23 TaxID=3415006 RepID=UPI003C703B2E
MTDLSLVPRVDRLTRASGVYLLDGSTRIAAPDALAGVVAWLQGVLRPATGLRLADGAGDGAGITLDLDESLGHEAYRMEVRPAGVRITGGDEAGAFYGAQVLRQLLPADVYRTARVGGVEWAVPAVDIEDSPRFAWRGAHLDVARHFMPKHDVLRFIDLLAMHRLNVLHWHLTEDQGWRIEIRKYPRLTSVGSWRKTTQVGAGVDAPEDGRPHGGFYTQDDVREIVAYAAARQITVVPEIDVPGHSQAAIAAYPRLGVGAVALGGEAVVEPRQLEVHSRWGVIEDVLNMEESTVEFYLDVFTEVMELFPGAFIGVGGDECPKVQWQADPRTQELMRERGLDDEEQLQAWFISRLDEHITAQGRRLFGWDEILEGGAALSDGATVASWRGMTGAVAAAKRGHDVVACPDDQVYLDYRQSEGPDEPIPVSISLTLEDVYGFEPVPPQLTAEEATHVIGGQANIWTEFMDSPRTVDFFAYPRLCAVADVLWSDAPRDVDAFSRRLDGHLARLDAVGVEYRPLSGPLPWQMRPGIPGRPSTREERAAFVESLVANIAP